MRRGSYNEFSFWKMSEKRDFQSKLPEILSVWSWFLLMKVQVHFDFERDAEVVMFI